MDETKFLEYYNDLTRQIADPIIDNVNYINLRVTGNGLHAFVNYCLEKEREANKANSENANCAIFDVSKMLPDLEHCKNAADSYADLDGTGQYGLVRKSFNDGINWALNFIVKQK